MAEKRTPAVLRSQSSISDYTNYTIPELDGDLEYHCFIAYSFKESDIAQEIHDHLAELGFKVCYAGNFPLGQPLVDNISNGMEKSRRALVLMSQSYLKSDWYEHEALLMIHNNQAHQRQMIIPIIIDLTEEELKSSKLGVYSYQYLKYEGTQKDLCRIAYAVAGENIPLKVCLPCGNVAQGLVWSYYYGYLKLILPDLRSRCESSTLAKEKNIHVIPKVFILVPDNGFCPSKITAADPNITEAGKLDPVYRTRAGKEERRYINTIYKVKGQTEGEEYFLPCEYATPILPMFEMCEEGFAGLPEDEKRHQICNFKDMLNQVLSHSKAATEGTRYAFKIICYQADDEGKADIASEIINVIKLEHSTLEATKEELFESFVSRSDQ